MNVYFSENHDIEKFQKRFRGSWTVNQWTYNEWTETYLHVTVTWTGFFYGQLLKSFSQCLMWALILWLAVKFLNIINTGIWSVYQTVYCSTAQRPTSAWRSAFTARVTRSAPTATLLSTSTRCWRSNSEVSEENQTMLFNCSSNQHGFAYYC